MNIIRLKQYVFAKKSVYPKTKVTQLLPSEKTTYGVVLYVQYRQCHDSVILLQVFLAAQRKVAEATSYYSLKDRASDYVLVTQDSSKLYRDLAALEPSADRKCKMHKR